MQERDLSEFIKSVSEEANACEECDHDEESESPKFNDNIADVFFSAAIQQKASYHLVPWEPTRRMLKGVGKDRPAVVKRILQAMELFFHEHRFIPVDPKLEYVMGKHYGKWHMIFSAEDRDEQLSIKL